MQKNNQQYEQFLREFGALLTAHTRHGHAVQQHQALLHLAEYVGSARRHHRLSRAMLAQKTGKGEAEIYALERGLLPYGELDLRFLHKLAVALDEDLETLLLLLGRPALAHTLQRQEAGHGNRTPTSLHHQHPSRRRPAALGQRGTAPQLGDNLLPFARLTNLLYKGYLNLIDSVQEGRLLGDVRHRQRTWLPMTMFVCLLCLCVGTYSFIGHFGAQSTLQSYAVAPAQTAIPPVTGIPVSQVLVQAAAAPSATAPTHERLYRQVAPHPMRIANAMAEPLDDSNLVNAPSAALSFLGLQTFDPTVQCDLRTAGRFALCRI